jgi:pimeloyl-ACP methyl ester carboxylesterase
MPFVTTKDGTEICYKDWGSGQPIVFHHGWRPNDVRPYRCNASVESPR